MDPTQADFARLASTISFTDPRVPLISHVTGREVSSGDLKRGEWCMLLGETENINAGLNALAKTKCSIYMEMGSQSAWLDLAKKGLSHAHIVTCEWLSFPSYEQDPQETMLKNLTSLFLKGIPVDWEKFYAPLGLRKVSLPTYLDIDEANASDLKNIVLELNRSVESADRQVAFRAEKRFVPCISNLSLPNSQEGALDLSATYLITGGLGEIGLNLASWLALKGVKNIALMSRQPPTISQRTALHAIEELGIRIKAFQADLSKEQDVGDVLNSLNVDWPRLKGVFHCAGLLDDGLMVNQTIDRFEKVLAPKAVGAWNLHTQTLKLQLDFFVLFSSIAAISPSIGQSNYATANAFLDGLAHYRKQNNLPALSINWGPWEIGMAKKLSASFISKGLIPLRISEALEVLDKVLFSEKSQVVVFKGDLFMPKK